MTIVSMKKLLMGFCLAMLLPLSAHASEDIGSLLKQAESARSTDPKAFASALDEIEKVKAAASPSQQWQFRLLRAYQSAMRGRYDAAIQQALEVHKETSDVAIKFRAGLLVANTAAITRDFSLGLRHLESALAMQDLIQDSELRQTGFGVAALLYNQHGQYALAQHYADQVLSQDPAPRNRCFARQIRVEALHGLGSELDEDEINAGIADCEAQREFIISNLLRGYLARRWAAKGQTDRAIELLESHLAEVEASHYPRLVGEIHGLLAEYRLILGDVQGAERHARSALAGGGNDAYSLPLVTAHKVLYEVALRRKDLATALDQYRRYAEADKARLDEIKAREFAFQLSRNELQQKNQAIELLQRQNDVLRLQQEVAKKSAINNRLLVLMLLLVLGVGTYWAYKIKRVQVMFRKQAQVDSLTGIFNRGHFRAQAEAQLARCEAAEREAALVLLDLDNFKRINDRHGHATGDWVLRQVAAACHASCREGDLFGRLGGEEFAILSCGGDLHTAERIAQKCREYLAAIDASAIDGGIPAITASFGCASTNLCGHSFEQLFMHADRAMYRAKAEGRDRICMHEDNRPVPLRLHVPA
ncbi:GGDEF domain-containing protein [Lysobacter rhizosphaerae]